MGSLSIRQAASMEYNFDTREADVVYADGLTFNPHELQDYFDDATDCSVRQINVTIGTVNVTLARDAEGKWLPM